MHFFTILSLPMPNLSREQVKAYNFYSRISREDPSILQNKWLRVRKNSAMLPTDFYAGNAIPIEKTSLPRESHWAWNQNNAKICVKGSDGELVTFIKITPRKRYFGMSAPNFKIWLFHATYPSHDFYFLWCEKGAAPEANGISTEIGMVYPEELTLTSFAFLAPFVDPFLARELGWET